MATLPIRCSVAHFLDDSSKSAERHQRAQLLIVRFSSFGDILQATAVPRSFRNAFAGAEVDWLVRSDFASLLETDPDLRRVIAFDRVNGPIGLLGLAWSLGGAGYTHVYDAHNNLRSRLVCWTIRVRALLSSPRSRISFARRPKSRLKRWLLFRLRLSLLPRPFRGAMSFLEPLKPWGIETKLPLGPHVFPASLADPELEAWPEFVALAPSAAWETKRWPPERWIELIHALPEARFVVLGGPEDGFCADLAAAAPERVLNLAGQRNLQGSLNAIARSRLLVSADTGLLHAADMMGRPAIALIGPTAFGYPSGATSETIEIELPCKPCSKDGRDPCRNAVDRLCMWEIKTSVVAQAVQRRLFKVEPELR